MTNWTILTDLKDLKYLQDLYRKHIPKTNHGFYTLNNFIKYFELKPNVDHVKIYVLENWKESGFFVIADRYQLIINTLILNADELVNALKSWDWSKKYKLFALPASLFPVIERTFKELNIDFRMRTYKIYQKASSLVNDKVVEIPDSLELRSLSIKDAKTINDHWHSPQDGSLEHIRSLIEYNISFGLYTKDTNELVAWCTRCQCGFLGTLHVKDEYRGRGLAKLLIEIFSRKIIELGEDIRTIIRDENLISQALFHKLGFEPQEDAVVVFNL